MLQSASQGRWAVIRIGVAYFGVCVQDTLSVDT